MERIFQEGRKKISGANSYHIDASEYVWLYYGLPKADYMVAAIQDKNGNRQIDFDEHGNATEKYALSKQARAQNGKIPDFKDCMLVCTDPHSEIVLYLE